MGSICSRSSSEDIGEESETIKEPRKSSVQVVTPSNKDAVVVEIHSSHGGSDSMSKHGILQPPPSPPPAAKEVQEDSKTRIIERPKEGHRRRATNEMDNGGSGLGSIRGGVESEQIAAGWPSWLTSVASEAIVGWVPRSAESFEKLNKIGQGTYSSVYKARDLNTGKIVAMKKVRFVNMDPESVRFMAREINILRRLDHPNIMKLEALVTSRISGSLYLVFEYMEHDLSGLAANPNIKFTESQIKCYMQQLLSGLEHCHKRGILHRDIKGSNLLLDNNGVLKIGDFGLATFYHPDKKQPLTSRVVTLWYRAPELLLGATDYGVAIDMWSVGCILAELFAGKPIMPGRTEVEQMHKIFKLCGSPSEEYWRKSKLPHSTSFKPQQPYKRRVAETFKDFPSSALALVDILLAMEPDQRGTASSALSHEFFTTKPPPCDPSSLPKYPPSKEFDAKLREEEARRQKIDPGKTRGTESVKGDTRESKGERTPEFSAHGQAQSNKSTSVKFNPQEESGTGFPIEPPRMKVKNGFSHSNSMIHPSSGYTSWSKKVKEDSCHTGMGTTYGSTRQNPTLSRQRSHMPQVVIGLSQNQPKKDDIATTTETMGYAPKRNRIHFSGPLMPPGGNMDDMLKEHERQIQEAVRKARLDQSRTKKNCYE